MKLLALDTATEAMALGLADDGASVTHLAEGGAQASAALLPAVLALLADRGLRPAQLQGIAFGRGPGAFTGLRTAVSAAQGLAFGIGCPVWPIDSLLIVAEDARRQAAPDGPFSLWVAMDARMDEVYGAAYRHVPGQGWTTEVEPALWDLPTLHARWALQPPAAVAGSALPAFGERLSVPAGVPTWPACADRAGALLALASAAAAAGPGLPAEQALPLYLRDKVAQTTAEREAAKAAAAANTPPAG